MIKRTDNYILCIVLTNMAKWCKVFLLWRKYETFKGIYVKKTSSLVQLSRLHRVEYVPIETSEFFMVTRLIN